MRDINLFLAVPSIHFDVKYHNYAVYHIIIFFSISFCVNRETPQRRLVAAMQLCSAESICVCYRVELKYFVFLRQYAESDATIVLFFISNILFFFFFINNILFFSSIDTL